MRRWKADGGDQKHRLEYDLRPNSVVLDMGGYRGEWADEIHSRYGCAIHIFEPVAAFANEITDRFENNPSIHVHRYGLGQCTRSESICLSADASSMFQRDGVVETIRLVDVADWFQQRQLHHVDLMKINIEGGEYELLERMIEKDLASRVGNIQVQFHKIGPDSEARMNHILGRLRSTHQPTYQYHFVWENWRRRAA